ncbi:uncharacterized protein LOC135379092 isoform X2 [Ornithodoros turicata]
MTSIPAEESERGELHEFLRGAHLLCYYDKFKEIVADSVQRLYDLTEEGLKEVIDGVGMAGKPLHVKRFKDALKRRLSSAAIATSVPANETERELHEFLRRANLLSYYNKFIEIGGDSVQQLFDSTEEEFQEFMDLVAMAGDQVQEMRLKKALELWTGRDVSKMSITAKETEGELHQLLRQADLLSYHEKFIEIGREKVQELHDHREFQEATDRVGMTRKPLHVKRFKNALERWKNDAGATPYAPLNESQRELHDLLERAKLLSYYGRFIEIGGDNVYQLYYSTKEDSQDVVRQVGMARKRFHVNRFKRALEQWVQHAGTCDSGTPAQKSAQDDHSIAVEKSPETENIRTEMHRSIDRRDVDRVTECLQAEPRLKMWLHPETKESAMHRAVENNAFQIYALLLSQKCKFKSTAESDCLCCLNPLHISELERQENFAIEPTGSHIKYLKSKSKSIADCDGFDDILDNLYRALDSIDLLKPVLKVASRAPYLSIRFDFEQKHVQCMAGGLKDVLGLTRQEKQIVYIGANELEPSGASKDRAKEVAGTLIHELCHLAVFLVYGNEGKPYRSTDTVSRERYADIVNDVRGRKGDLHKILQLALHENVEEELIVRIPHILALLPAEANTVLEQQVQKLYEFYKDKVVEDMKQCIRNGCPIKDIEIIKEENGRLGKASSTEQLGIEFEAGLDESILQREPLLILIASNITLLEVMVNDLLRCATVSYLFLEASRLGERTKDVLRLNKCEVLLVPCDSKGDLRRILQFWEELHDVTGTKIILLTSEGNLEHCFQEVEKTSSHDSKLYIDVIHSATFENVTSKCKSDVIRNSQIALQSSNAQTYIHRILDIDSFLKICQEDTFLTLCREKVLFLGPRLQELPKNISECYIEQKCGKSVEVDLHKITGRCQDDAFAVFGCSKENLHSFLPAGLTVKRMSDLDKFQQIVILESDREYDLLVEHEHYTGRTIHLLEFQEQRFIWKKSNGAVSHLPMTGEEIYSANSLLKTNEKVILVSGDPGMGKTVLATQLCREIKKADKKAWVLYVSNYPNTQEAIEMFNKGTGGINFKQFAKLCCVKTSGEEFQLFQQSVTKGSPFNVWVIFDALDEIHEASRKTIIDFTKLLAQARLFKVLLFTRTICRNPTEDEMHSVAFRMIPFSGEDQAQFQNKYEKYARQIQPSVPNIMIDDKTSQGILYHVRAKADYLLGNPLILKMVTEVEQGIASDSDYCELVQRTCSCRDCYTPLLVYRLFIEYTYLRYRKEKKCEDITKDANKVDDERLKKIFYHDHELLALKAVLSKDDLTRLLSESESSLLEDRGRLTMEVKENKQKHGLIQELRNGLPRFVHHIFAEFFAAYSIFKRVKQANDKGDEDVELIVSGMYGDSTHDGMLTFLDGFAAEGHAVHCSIMNNDIENLKASAPNWSHLDDIERTPLHVAALHANQDILKLLAFNEVLTQRDMLGMTPLRYADQMRSWETLDIFCARIGTSATNWSDEIPTAASNITTETELSRSVLMIVIGKRLKGLLSVLLKMFCKNKMCPTETCPKREIQHSTKNVRPSAATVHIPMDIDRIRDKEQRTPLHVAVRVGELDIVEVLLPYSSLNVRDIYGMTVFQSCAYVGHTNVLRHLLPLASAHDWYVSDNTVSEQKWAALYVGNPDAAELLIPHFLTRTSIKEGLLYENVVSGNDGVTKAILPHTDASGRYMPYGRPTFQACVGCADIDVVRLMLPYTDLDGSDERGTTTLRITADDIVSWDRHRTCDVDIAKLLILYCDIDFLDMDGKTALRMCIKCKDNFPVFKQVLLYMLVTCRSISQVMSVHYVAKAGEEDILNSLIPYTRINAHDENESTPLAHCCSHGYLRAAKLLLPLTAADFGSLMMARSLILGMSAWEYGIVELLLPHSLKRSVYGTLAFYIASWYKILTEFSQTHGQASLYKAVTAKSVTEIENVWDFLTDSPDVWVRRKMAATVKQAITAATKMFLPHVDVNVRTTEKMTMWLESVCQGHWPLVQIFLPYTETRDSDISQNTPLVLSAMEMSSAIRESSEAEDKRNVKMNNEGIQILKLLILHSDFGGWDADRALPQGGSVVNLHLMKSLCSHSSVNKLVFPHSPPASRSISVAEFIECLASIEEQGVLDYVITCTRINARDENGYTPLDHCCSHGYSRVAKLLLPLTVVHVVSPPVVLPWISCKLAGAYDIVKLLLPHSLKRSLCSTLAKGIGALYESLMKLRHLLAQASLRECVSDEDIAVLWNMLLLHIHVTIQTWAAAVTKLFLPHVDLNFRTTMESTLWLQSVYRGHWATVRLFLPYAETRDSDISQNKSLLLSASKVSSATSESSQAENKRNVEMNFEDKKVLKLLILHSNSGTLRADRVLPHDGSAINIEAMKMLRPHISMSRFAPWRKRLPCITL